ncbi:protein LTO1 homolog isoform X3 [Apodemus sylvaticus]|uniref:protein LTO1 homolog isoform X3 n=1 Tax=Apodemus sylvaticus TaxID=10129 RepID=UPI002241F978|nr:protein LTO1 homolog isoform X3 [Apodemus sylvaticus]
MKDSMGRDIRKAMKKAVAWDLLKESSMACYMEPKLDLRLDATGVLLLHGSVSYTVALVRKTGPLCCTCCVSASPQAHFLVSDLNMMSSLPSASKNQGESTLPPQCPLAFSWNAEGPMPILLDAMWLWAEGVYRFLGHHLYNRL